MATPRANRSDAWQHMKKISASKVQCMICSKELALSKSGSTSTLNHHLRAMHPSVFGAPDKSSQRSMSSFAQHPCSNTRQEKITALLVKCIVSNMLPLALVENEAFRDLISYLEPQYKMPCRATVCARLTSQKAELSKTIEEEMVDAPAVHLTTDIWSSIANDAYIGTTSSYITKEWQLKAVTLTNEPMEERHTQANIAARLGNTATAWGISDKVKTVVHDGAANMKETASANKWIDVGCSAHKLHLSVTGRRNFANIGLTSCNFA